MTANPPAVLNVRIPSDLRKRGREVAKHFNTCEAEILRLCYREKIEELEKKMDEEKAREAMRKQRETGRFGLNRYVKTYKAPKNGSPTTPPPRPSVQSRLDVIFAEHAKIIAKAKDDHVEAALAAAIKAIRNYAPLTAGSNDMIIAKLEPLVAREREAHQKEESAKIVSQLSNILHGRAEDELVGKEIDFDDEVGEDE